MRTVESAFAPSILTLRLPCDEALIAAAHAELQRKAAEDAYKCFGYFPGMRAHANELDFNLSACQAFAAAVPELLVAEKQLDFGFLRMSLIKQSGISPYHVDSDASAALTGDEACVSKKQIWRLLMNMSDTHERTLSYLNIDPSSVKLANKNGYVHFPETAIADTYVRTVIIPPRRKTKVVGVLFCASRVLHAGQDDEFGHFVAGYGCEQ